jgi:hypothetical protein
MNQETKGTDDIDRMESKSGIALARMNASIQKKKKKKKKKNSADAGPDNPCVLVVLAKLMLDLHKTEGLCEDEFDGCVAEHKRSDKKRWKKNTVRDLSWNRRCYSERRAVDMLLCKPVNDSTDNTVHRYSEDLENIYRKHVVLRGSRISAIAVTKLIADIRKGDVEYGSKSLCKCGVTPEDDLMVPTRWCSGRLAYPKVNHDNEHCGEDRDRARN